MKPDDHGYRLVASFRRSLGSVMPRPPLLHRLLLACLVGAGAALPCGAAPAAKPEHSKAELQQLQSRIETLKQDMERAQSAHSEAADALKESEASISETNRKLFELAQQQQTNRNTLKDLEQQKSGLAETLNTQQQLLNTQLYQQYVAGQQSYARIVLSEKNPSERARELHYYSYVSHARAALLADIRKNLRHIASLDEATHATLKEVGALKVAQEAERKRLQTEKDSRKRVLTRLASKIEAQRGEISKLQRDEKRLSDLIERLSRIVPSAPKPRKPPKSAGHTPQAPRDEPARINQDTPSDAVAGTGFANLRGRLHLPVRGNLTNKFGASREESGIAWKGLFIKADDGAEVKAIADGRVVFADWLRGFGNLLIIDHGDGYMSLYGNNQALLRKVGDTIGAGDAIASVGNSGGNALSGLYFELRHQGKPFDPLSWCVVR